MEEGFYTVEAILDKRFDAPSQTWLYLIKWENYPDTESTWEPEANLEYMPEILAHFNREYNQRIQSRRKQQEEKINRLLRRKRNEKRQRRLQKAQQMMVAKTAHMKLDEIEIQEENKNFQMLQSQFAENFEENFEVEVEQQEFRLDLGMPVRYGVLKKDRASRIIGAIYRAGIVYYVIVFYQEPQQSSRLQDWHT